MRSLIWLSIVLVVGCSAEVSYRSNQVRHKGFVGRWVFDEVAEGSGPLVRDFSRTLHQNVEILIEPRGSGRVSTSTGSALLVWNEVGENVVRLSFDDDRSSLARMTASGRMEINGVYWRRIE